MHAGFNGKYHLFNSKNDAVSIYILCYYIYSVESDSSFMYQTHWLTVRWAAIIMSKGPVNVSHTRQHNDPQCQNFHWIMKHICIGAFIYRMRFIHTILLKNDTTSTITRSNMFLCFKISIYTVFVNIKQFQFFGSLIWPWYMHQIMTLLFNISPSAVKHNKYNN